MATAVGFLTGGAGVASYASGFAPMMILGDFMFSLNTAAFQELIRTTNYRWASQEQFGKHEALQYVGPGTDTITLPGVVYPNYRGSAASIAKLRTLAAKGKPQRLLDATGNVMGRWVIESVDETRSTFAPMGIPRKLEFTVKLRHFDGGDFNVIAQKLKSLSNSVKKAIF